MIRNLVDIYVFKTPFDEKKIFLEKFKKVKGMFDDYIINANLELKKTEKETEFYTIYNYKNDKFDIEINFFLKKDLLDEKNLFPGIIINYHLNEYKFLKKNIETFLNDNIKFIYNVYFDDFFINYDEKFDILDINKGKKIDYNNLKKFDLNNKKSRENKQILDSMMYLYYTNIKNIFEINENNTNIKSIFKEDLHSEFSQNLKLFNIRQTDNKKNLFNISLKLKEQINIFITLIK